MTESSPTPLPGPGLLIRTVVLLGVRGIWNGSSSAMSLRVWGCT
jgi:hypothetical protein